jgi:hypothetical protein
MILFQSIAMKNKTGSATAKDQGLKSRLVVSSIMLTPVRLCLIVILFSPIPVTQAADTLKIQLTYQHIIPDGKHTKGYITIKQRFFTPDDTLFREINYDTATRQISSYIFYFYRDNHLFTEECYNQHDTLLYIHNYEYDKEGNVMAVLTFERRNDQLTLVRKESNLYKPENRLAQKTTLQDGKKIQKIRYAYNKSGQLTRESRKDKPLFYNGIRSENITCQYGPDGKLRQLVTLTKSTDHGTFTRKEDYSYNEKGLLSETKVSNDKDELIMTRTLKYLDSGAKSVYQETDRDGLITKLLQYDYKKHYMNKGNQVSSFNR